MSRSNTMAADQLTDSGYYILLSLLVPRHGYGIMKYIEELSDEEVTMGPATLYTVIKKLQQAGFIAQVGEEEDRRKTYRITDKGNTVIREEIERRARMARHGAEALQATKGEG